MTKRDEAMEMLDQLQGFLKHYEQATFEGGGYRSVTVLALLTVTRVVYWLLERWIRSNEDAAKN